MKKVIEGLEKCKREREQKESWYKNWFSTSPRLTTLIPSILRPFVGLLLLCSFVPWAFKCLITLTKKQVDELAAKPIQIHYHHLAMEDREIATQTPRAVTEQPKWHIQVPCQREHSCHSHSSWDSRRSHKVGAPIINKFAE